MVRKQITTVRRVLRKKKEYSKKETNEKFIWFVPKRKKKEYSFGYNL